ncbi:MAG: hypothetical protein KGL39_51745 [Patescibacteria group bacterium]|nr:hypothetical protein [Patescibacteria group bacterium]
MSLASRLRFWRRDEPPREELVGTFAAKIRYVLRRDYPGLNVMPNGHYDYVLKLPRGALSKVAREVGCSRAYVGQVAREAGYTKGVPQ